MHHTLVTVSQILSEIPASEFATGQCFLASTSTASSASNAGMHVYKMQPLLKFSAVIQTTAVDFIIRNQAEIEPAEQKFGSLANHRRSFPD
jgi:hypothetical protein